MYVLKDAFYSLKSNKNPGYDDFKYLFNLSVEKGVFPGELKIARVTLIYNVEDSSDISNNRPISVLPCFCKILELIMYKHLYKYHLIENNILYSK